MPLKRPTISRRPFQRDGADGLVEEAAADRVVDHAGAAAAGEALTVLEAGFAS